MGKKEIEELRKRVKERSKPLPHSGVLEGFTIGGLGDGDFWYSDTPETVDPDPYGFLGFRTPSKVNNVVPLPLSRYRPKSTDYALTDGRGNPLEFVTAVNRLLISDGFSNARKMGYTDVRTTFCECRREFLFFGVPKRDR